MTAILERPVDADTTTPDACETTWIGGVCDNPADYIVSSHITPAFYLCHDCWSAEGEVGTSRCQVTGDVETRDGHFRIVEVLR